MPLKMSQFDKAHMTSYLPSIVTMALTRVLSGIFNVENVVTLNSGSKVTRGHRNRHVSIRHLWFPINVP